MKFRFATAAAVFASSVHSVSGILVPGDGPDGCWTSTTPITQFEFYDIFSNTLQALLGNPNAAPSIPRDMTRTYVLCPNTAYVIGRQAVPEDNVPEPIVGGMWPLGIVNPNVEILCGSTTGERIHNCSITTLEYALLGVPPDTVKQFGQLPDGPIFEAAASLLDISNLTVRGLTFENSESCVSPVSLAAPGENILLDDCAWKNHVVAACNPEGSDVSLMAFVLFPQLDVWESRPYLSLSIENSVFQDNLLNGVSIIDAFFECIRGAPYDGDLEECLNSKPTSLGDRMPLRLHNIRMENNDFCAASEEATPFFFSPGIEMTSVCFKDNYGPTYDAIYRTRDDLYPFLYTNVSSQNNTVDVVNGTVCDYRLKEVECGFFETDSCAIETSPIESVERTWVRPLDCDVIKPNVVIASETPSVAASNAPSTTSMVPSVTASNAPSTTSMVPSVTASNAPSTASMAPSVAASNAPSITPTMESGVLNRFSVEGVVAGIIFSLVAGIVL